METLIFADLLEREGVTFSDDDEKHQIIKELKEAVEKGQFHFIVKDGVRIGFFCYHENIVNGKKHIYIDNLLVFKKYRKSSSLLNLRKFLRSRCNNINFYFYHVGRKDKFSYWR